jgi:hypothetical protein
MSDKEKYIKIISFSGKKEDWEIWESKFSARARKKGYKDVLTRKMAVPKDSETNLNARQKKAREMNDEAYADLMLAMDTEESSGKVAFRIVRSAKNNDYAKGSAALAWEKLTKKYAPTTAPSRVKLSKMFYQAKLKEGQDPEEYITYLEDLRDHLDECGYKMNDEQFMVQVLNSLTKEYETQVDRLEQKLGINLDPLDIESLREQLSLKYERLHGDNDSEVSKKNKEEEAVMYASDKKYKFKKQFKGRCKKCGKYGHMVKDCHGDESNDNQQGNGFQGECFYCKKKGRKKQDCYEFKKREQANLANGEAVFTAFNAEDLEYVPDEGEELYYVVELEPDEEEPDEIVEYEIEKVVVTEPDKGIPDDFFDKFERSTETECDDEDYYDCFETYEELMNEEEWLAEERLAEAAATEEERHGETVNIEEVKKEACNEEEECVDKTEETDTTEENKTEYESVQSKHAGIYYLEDNCRARRPSRKKKNKRKHSVPVQFNDRNRTIDRNMFEVLNDNDDDETEASNTEYDSDESQWKTVQAKKKNKKYMRAWNRKGDTRFKNKHWNDTRSRRRWYS